MSYSCPMSFKQIDSNVSRLTSLLVSTLVVVYLFSDMIFLLYFLLFDFIMRLFIKKDNSPLYMLALGMKELFKIKENFIDSGAKRLATYFGLSFVVMLILTHYIDIYFLSLTIAVIFLACSLLDVFLNYCLGCKIYFIIKKIYPKFMT